MLILMIGLTLSVFTQKEKTGKTDTGDLKSKRLIVEIPETRKKNNEQDKKKKRDLMSEKEKHFFEERQEKLKNYYINEMEKFRYQHLWDYEYRQPLKREEPLETDARRFEVVFLISIPFCLAYSYLAVWLFTAFENRILTSYFENQTIAGNDIRFSHWFWMASGSALMAYLVAQYDQQKHLEEKKISGMPIIWPVLEYRF